MRGECERWEERKYGTVKKAKSHEKAMVDYQIVYGAKERTWRDFIVAPERKPKLAQKLEAGSRADYFWYRSSGRDSDDEYESDAWSEPDEEERTSAAERTQQDLGNAEKYDQEDPIGSSICDQRIWPRHGRLCEGHQSIPGPDLERRREKEAHSLAELRGEVHQGRCKGCQKGSQRCEMRLVQHGSALHVL